MGNPENIDQERPQPATPCLDFVSLYPSNRVAEGDGVGPLWAPGQLGSIGSLPTPPPPYGLVATWWHFLDLDRQGRGDNLGDERARDTMIGTVPADGEATGRAVGSRKSLPEESDLSMETYMFSDSTCSSVRPALA